MPTTAEQLAILVANTDGMLTTVTAVKDSFTASKDTAVAAAVDATTQAGIATTQAGISTGKATEALSSANASAASAASAAEIVNISSVTTFTNPLSRAVQIRTSSSSERGIQQLSSSRIDSASLPCGETVALALIDYTPSGIVKLSNKHNGSVGVIFELLTTGFLRLTLNATTYTSTVAVSVVDGDFTVFDWSYFIPAASSAGGIVFAVNGVQIGTTVSVTAGTPINTTNVANKFVLGTSSVSESAVFLYYKLWKSHRTPAEILSTLVNGTQIADSARSGIGATLTGSNKWSGIAAGADGKLYCGPYDATDILIIDPVAGTATRSAMGATLTGSAKWNGIAAGADGKLYCAPFNATDILIIDPVAGTATRSDMGATLTGTFKWIGIAAGADGKLYCAPLNDTNILIIDPVAGTASRSDMGATLTGTFKWTSIAAGADGKLYCGPYEATDILIIDPVAGTATRSDMGATLTGSSKWQGIAAGADGKLYCAPFNATDILIIDPVAGTASRSAMGATLTGTFKWNGIAAGADGKLYCATRSATDILIIDPVAGTATRSAMGATLTGSNKWTSIAAGADGKLYCGPYEATDILIIKNLIASSLSAEDCQSDTGQILDRANNNHALMPASGATVYPQNLRPEIRGKNTWAATSELQYVSGVNQALYSASHYFEGIIVVPSAATTTGFTVGNGANASYYATVPGPLVAGDPIYIPLANRFSDGINRKLTITPMAAWTVSLNVTALGHVLEIS